MEREPEPGERRWSLYRSPKSRGPGGAGAPPLRTRRRGLPFIVVMILVAVVIALAAQLVFTVTGSDSGSTPDAVFGSEPAVQVLTADGIDDLVEAIEEETGSTEVFGATIYPTYAVVSVPADATSRREIGYYWDGRDLEASGSKGTSSSARLDLADIDAGVVPPLVAEARAQIEDPTSWYVIIDRDRQDDRGWLSAYASNDFDEGGYILADRKGRELNRVTW